MKTIIFIFAVICIASCNYFQQLQQLQSDYANCPLQHITGNALVVIKNGKTIYKQVAGYRDLANNLPVTNNSIFAMGSITKQFTTILLGQLYDEGLIDFDVPITTYIPEFQTSIEFATQSLTLHDVLTMHSGLARNDFLIYINSTKTDSQFLYELQNWPFATSPRYQSTYNSWGYVIAGIVLERVTKQSYETLIQTRILTPLGMNHSYPSFEQTVAYEANNLAYGHSLQNNNGHLTPVNIVPRNMDSIFDGVISSAGGLHLSVNDLESYLTAINNVVVPDISAGTFTLVTQERLKATSPQMLDLSSSYGIYIGLYAYGLINGEYNGHHYYAHNGGTIGSSSYIVNFPNDGISIGLVTNQDSVNSESYFLLFDQIFNIVNGGNYDSTQTCTFSQGGVLLPFTGLPSTNVTNGKPGQYVGTYYNSVYGYIYVYNATTSVATDEVWLNFGWLQGRLRPTTGSNTFLWYTENSYEADSLTFSFVFNTYSDLKAKSISVSLDPTVPNYIFSKVAN